MGRDQFLRAALAYALELDWPVFPVKPRGKEPLTKHGYKDATVDEAQIRAWWKQWPDANIGIPTGIKFWVLDIDPRNGGEESLEALINKHGPLTNTLQQISGGGGRHYLFQLPDQQVIKNGTLAQGIDVKGEGGYILVAPSIHPSGKPYTWDGARPITRQEFLPAGGWLLEQTKGSRNGQAVPTLPERIPHGKQHETLFRMGCYLRSKGFGQDELFAALWAANQKRCEKPGPLKNIENLAASICTQYPAGGTAPVTKSASAAKGNQKPAVFDVEAMRSAEIPKAHMLIESFLPTPGAILMVGAQKAGKTVLSMQMGIAVATGKPLFSNYRVGEGKEIGKAGPVLFVEVDDPNGLGSLKEYDAKAALKMIATDPFFIVPKLNFEFGPQFLVWLEGEIKERNLKLVILDSYTKLRPHHQPGADIVKVEQSEIGRLDALAKQANCALVILHHPSKTSRAKGLHWTDESGGTYAMEAAAEGLIHVARFLELEDNAPERIVRIRMRHGEDLQLVLRFRKETLDYQIAFEGTAADCYPLLLDIRHAFPDKQFTPQDLSRETGVSRQTATRQIHRLLYHGAIRKEGHGSYRVKEGGAARNV
jgi:hypothetical protein